MSDEPPPPIIRRVKSRSSRVRDASPTSLENAENSPAVTPETLATKLKNKHRRSKQTSRLSFGSDDQTSDGEVFKVKKSNLSRNLSLGSASTTEVSVPANLDQASISSRSTGPSYTKAYIDELKASTPSTPATRPPGDLNLDTSYDTSFDNSFDIDGAIVENASEVFAGTTIPSESAISAAKEKRGRLREIGDNEDFISLSVTKHGDGPKGPHPESRLMREEDELGEGEDDMAEYTGAQERIALGKKARKDEERKRREGMVEMIEAAEEDDESVEWERAQVSRAVHTDNDGSKGAKPPKATYIPAPIPVVTPIPTLSAATARLAGALNALMSSHASHTAELSSLATEQAAIEVKEAELRQMVEKAERKRSWFAAFQEWMEGVASFLDEKFPRLESIEDEYISLLSERYEMVSKRRRMDDEDDIALFLGVPPTVSATESAETDEHGRVISSQNTTPALRATRRAARANRRLLRRAQNQVLSAEEDEGYSTDGSLPPADADDYRTALITLAERQADVLSDVRSEEFRDPRVGLAEWFGEWREKYEDNYVSAWGGLGLVAAWEFWARLEMVGWNPLQDTSRGLDSFNWATDLHDYSRPRKEADVGIEDGGEPEIGPGGDMVSSMISQITPRLCKLIEGGAFDPYSTPHVRGMIDLTEQVEASIEADGTRFQSLLKSVHVVFHTAVMETQNLLAPSLGPANPGAPFDPQSVPARRRFLTRRLKLLVNLLKWRKYTGERFGVGELATVLVQSCILPVAERGMEVGGETVLRIVVEKMPPELVPREVTMRLR